MNGDRKCKLIFYFALPLILVHFLVLAIDQFGFSQKLKIYVYPYFEQNWSLFAPPPSESYQIIVQMKDGGAVNLNVQTIKQNSDGMAWASEMVANSITNAVHFVLSEDEEQISTSKSILKDMITNYTKISLGREPETIYLLATKGSGESKPRVIILH